MIINDILTHEASKPQIDWARATERYHEMSDADICSSISGLHRVLPYSDDLDQTDGGTRGSYYRDELSVARAELAIRQLPKILEQVWS